MVLAGERKKKEEYAKPRTEGREVSYGKIGLTTVAVTQDLLSKRISSVTQYPAHMCITHKSYAAHMCVTHKSYAAHMCVTHKSYAAHMCITHKSYAAHMCLSHKLCAARILDDRP